MHDFISYIYYSFREAVVPALALMAAGAVVLAALYWWWYVKDGRERRVPFLKRSIAILLLLCYLGGLLAVTVLQRTNGSGMVQLHLFRAFREAWNAFTLQVWVNPLLNIAMFVPLGVLLPLTAKPFRRWCWTLAAGAGTSLAVEALQYLLERGQADVDDLFCNTLGTMLGYCLCMFVVCSAEKRWRQVLAYAALPALSAAVLAGVFAAYQLRPYGNLADAPAFAAYTGGTRWVLECGLSDEPGPAGVYWAEPFTTASCDEFAVEFLERQGFEIDFDRDVDYYDNTTFYSDHQTFSLWVYHNDRSYNYTDLRVEFDLRYSEKKGTATEEELRAALAGLGIDVPAGAEFQETERPGVYLFLADDVEKDGRITTGSLACRVAADGSLYEVENSMSVCTLYGDALVISEQEAYERLQAGWFSLGDMFEYYAPREVHIDSCRLEYRIDSKGFRQPVYLFELRELGAAVFVPALAG